MKDYYNTLDVPPDTSLDKIKEQYHLLLFAWHPDRYPDDQKAKAEAKTREIIEAYKFLSDPAKRKAYDARRQAEYAEEQRRQQERADEERQRRERRKQDEAEAAQRHTKEEQQRRQQAEAAQRQAEYERQRKAQAEAQRQQEVMAQSMREASERAKQQKRSEYPRNKWGLLVALAVWVPLVVCGILRFLGVLKY